LNFALTVSWFAVSANGLIKCSFIWHKIQALHLMKTAFAPALVVE
jgi:hypothetical protein